MDEFKKFTYDGIVLTKENICSIGDDKFEALAEALETLESYISSVYKKKKSAKHKFGHNNTVNN